MRKQLAIAAIVGTLLVAGIGSAMAATYYVSPTGSASNAGTAASPWTLAKANTTAAAGDVVVLAAGSYSTAIAPANAGTGERNRVTFVGSLANPSSTVVSGISLSKDYVSIKGVQFSGSFTITSNHDSLAWCHSNSGGVSFRGTATGNMVARCSITSDKLHFVGTDATHPVVRDTVQDCTFALTLNSNGPAIRMLNSNGLVLSRSRFYITIASDGNGGTWKIYETTNAEFKDCLFDITQNRDHATCDECGFYYLRDHSAFNAFTRDTFLLRGPHLNQMLPTASGSFPGSTNGIKYDSCIWRQGAPTGAGALYWQNGARSDTLLNCTVIADGQSAAYMWGFSGNSVVKNSTFISLGRAPAVKLGESWSGTTNVTNNIFYATGSGAAALILSTGAYQGNNNLFYTPSGSASAISTGSSTVSVAGFCVNKAQDCNSKFGDPLFVGGSTVWTFDPHLRAGSPAIGAGVGGVDVGAFPYGSEAGDVVAPNPVVDLVTQQVNDNSILLAWTATGDDGQSGQASSYDLRVSTQAITSANFGAATAIAQGRTPGTPGTSESYVATLLTPGTTYYFALKTGDEAANWSTISNAVSATTPAADGTPPGKIDDLHAGP